MERQCSREFQVMTDHKNLAYFTMTELDEGNPRFNDYPSRRLDDLVAVANSRDPLATEMMAILRDPCIRRWPPRKELRVAMNDCKMNNKTTTAASFSPRR